MRRIWPQESGKEKQKELVIVQQRITKIYFYNLCPAQSLKMTLALCHLVISALSESLLKENFIRKKRITMKHFHMMTLLVHFWHINVKTLCQCMLCRKINKNKKKTTAKTERHTRQHIWITVAQFKLQDVGLTMHIEFIFDNPAYQY